MFSKSRLLSKLLKISLKVKIYKNLEFGLNFRKCSVQIFENLDIGHNFRKIWLLAKILKISNLSNFRKLYQFFVIFYNLQFGENYG